MVEYAYWNTGASADDDIATIYANEQENQTVGGYIGIMNASDYGYAYYSANHSVLISNYGTSSITALNWLYQTGFTYTMTVYTSSAYVFHVSCYGYVGYSGAFSGYAVRPVLYLKSTNVYIVDGDGSVTDPYMLGTN